MFTKGKFGEDCLPPNKDALLLHISRANYVSYIWHRCLSPSINAPDFCDHGWQMDGNGDLSVKWLSCLPAMDNILESASCSCKTGCKNNRCSCRKEEFTCTELCSRKDCENKPSEDSSDKDQDMYQDIDFDDLDSNSDSE